MKTNDSNIITSLKPFICYSLIFVVCALLFVIDTSQFLHDSIMFVTVILYIVVVYMIDIKRITTNALTCVLLIVKIMVMILVTIVFLAEYQFNSDSSLRLVDFVFWPIVISFIQTTIMFPLFAHCFCDKNERLSLLVIVYNTVLYAAVRVAISFFVEETPVYSSIIFNSAFIFFLLTLYRRGGIHNDGKGGFRLQLYTVLFSIQILLYMTNLPTVITMLRDYYIWIPLSIIFVIVGLVVIFRDNLNHLDKLSDTEYEKNGRATTINRFKSQFATRTNDSEKTSKLKALLIYTFFLAVYIFLSIIDYPQSFYTTVLGLGIFAIQLYLIYQGGGIRKIISNISTRVLLVTSLVAMVVATTVFLVGYQYSDTMVHDVLTIIFEPFTLALIQTAMMFYYFASIASNKEHRLPLLMIVYNTVLYAIFTVLINFIVGKTSIYSSITLNSALVFFLLTLYRRGGFHHSNTKANMKLINVFFIIQISFHLITIPIISTMLYDYYVWIPLSIVFLLVGLIVACFDNLKHKNEINSEKKIEKSSVITIDSLEY